MNEITLHPNVYATGQSKGLVHLLERIWVRDHTPGDGTIFAVSGFANYNGGVRFYETFKKHKEHGGKIVAVFSGSASSRLSSKQVVQEMLGCGADVHIVNRKRLLHAKCYGTDCSGNENLIVTSGNFTGPGMSQNAEMSVLLEPKFTAETGFKWSEMVDSILSQSWDLYQPTLNDLSAPAWRLLYDEQARNIVLDDSDETTLLLRLSHADTARINATPGSDAGKGSQYFWLSKDCYDFFPPLTIRNERGTKATYSCLLNMTYVDINVVDKECRVTFEAENNLDFRLGTGKLRYTKSAAEGDFAAISRIGENDYQLRIFRNGSLTCNALIPHALHLIGNQGKKYGFIPNSQFAKITGVSLKKTLVH